MRAARPLLTRLLDSLTLATLLFASFLLAHAQARESNTGNAQPRATTPAELRRMTAAQFQAGIDREGAQAFTQRLLKENDPYNWDEPNYDILLNHIASGSDAWLHIAAQVAPYAESTPSLDPNFSTGLNVALAYALLENPAGVLRQRSTDAHFANACMYPFPQPTQAFVKRYQHRALLALGRVHVASLKSQAEQCRQSLLNHPTEKASTN